MKGIADIVADATSKRGKTGQFQPSLNRGYDVTSNAELEVLLEKSRPSLGKRILRNIAAPIAISVGLAAAVLPTYSSVSRNDSLYSNFSNAISSVVDRTVDVEIPLEPSFDYNLEMNKEISLEKKLMREYKIDLAAKQESAFEAKLSSIRVDPSIYSVDINSHDSLIIDFVDEYNNTFFSEKPGEGLDYMLVKQMILQESGGSHAAFDHDPMQVANLGDDALSVIRNGGEFTYLIADKELREDLQGIRHTSWRRGGWNYSDSNMTPELSIEMGIVWLLNKHAVSKSFEWDEEDVEQFEIRPGDNYWTVASTVGTDPMVLYEVNPDVNDRLLHAGQSINVVNPVIGLNWDSDWLSSAKEYNGGGSATYLDDYIETVRVEPEIKGGLLSKAIEYNSKI